MANTEANSLYWSSFLFPLYSFWFVSLFLHVQQEGTGLFVFCLGITTSVVRVLSEGRSLASMHQQ